MPLLCWSLNPNALSPQQRGQLAVPQHQLPDVLNTLRTPDIQEIILISTCQRFEFYVITSNPDLTRNKLSQWCQQRANLPPEMPSFDKHFTADTASFYLFEVAAGLKSVVLGEVEILGQLRRAWRIAQAAGHAGHHLNGLFRHALRTGRTIRHRTTLCHGAQSLESLAIEKGRLTTSSDADLRWLIVGTGQMGQAVLRQLKHRHIHRVRAINRSTRELDRSLGIHAESWEHLNAALEWADVVITCTSAPYPIIHAQNLPAQRSPQTLIDLSLPANIDPQVQNNSAFQDLQCWDLNTLHQELICQQEHKQGTLQPVRHYLFKGWQSYQQWQRERELAPFLRAVYAHTLSPRFDIPQRQALRRRLHPLVCGFKYSKAPQLRSHYHTQILEILRSA